MVIISELTWNVSNLKELLCTGITTITFNASVDVCYDGCLQNYTIQIITLLLFFFVLENSCCWLHLVII